jgi:amino acid transporter
MGLLFESRGNTVSEVVLAGEAHGLKKNAITFVSNVVIGVASTAPAYSLAAALGSMVMIVGFGVPAIMIAAFIPILFVAAAYYHLNRADPDCGTTFAWATRAMGPYGGWMGGWAIIVTDILVMPGLSQVAALYSFHLFGIGDPAWYAVMILGVAWIVIMTAICYFGIELSALTQKFLLAAEVVILVVFAVVALDKVYGAVPPEGSRQVALNWFNPFATGDYSDFAKAVLVAVFVYWGWDTGASVNEETESPRIAPARAAIVATVILVGLYVLVSAAAVAFAEPGLAKPSDDFLAPLATNVLGSGFDKLLILAVVTSTAACTQTTILPAARTVISMARAGALPKKFADIHPRYLTPGFATLVMGAVSIVYYVGLTFLPNGDILNDSVTATAFGIAFYYALTAFACVIYYRRELGKSLKNFVFIGVVPALGGLAMLALFVMAFASYRQPDQDDTAFFGIGPSLVLGVGALLLGLIVMAVARLALPEFFKREVEVVDPALVAVEANS